MKISKLIFSLLKTDGQSMVVNLSIRTFLPIKVQNPCGAELPRQLSGVPIILPYNEIKVGKGQHNDSEKRRHGSMKNGLQHMLEGNLDAMILVANAGDKANQDVK